MKFVSLFNPVSLPQDPESGEEGDLYYNSTIYAYRVKLGGSWVTLINEQQVKRLIAPEIFTIGMGSASVQVLLEQYHSENALYCVSASYTEIVIPEMGETSIHVGSRINIIRGSDGSIKIIKGHPDVDFDPPSDIYLTGEHSAGTLMNLGYNEWVFFAEYPDLY